MIKYLTMTIEKQKNIALIAHDGKKQDMLKWCMDNKEILQQHNLSGTGTTARMIADHVGLKIKGYNSGPLGGDQQIGAKIVEGNIDMVIFFSDPLAAQPHDPDVKALLRIAQVYDIPIANNIATTPFRQSPINVNIAPFFPTERNMFVAPAFPLPFSLTSNPAIFLLIITEKLMLPNKYATSVTIMYADIFIPPFHLFL